MISSGREKLVQAIRETEAQIGGEVLLSPAHELSEDGLAGTEESHFFTRLSKGESIQDISFDSGRLIPGYPVALIDAVIHRAIAAPNSVASFHAHIMHNGAVFTALLARPSHSFQKGVVRLFSAQQFPPPVSHETRALECRKFTGKTLPILSEIEVGAEDLRLPVTVVPDDIDLSDVFYDVSRCITAGGITFVRKVNSSQIERYPAVYASPLIEQTETCENCETLWVAAEPTADAAQVAACLLVANCCQ